LTGDHEYEACKDTGTNAKRSTYCKCIAPEERTCTGTTKQVTQCKIQQFNSDIKPYFMCLMRRRLESVQKVWLYKNWEWFNTKNEDQNENSRVPSMLRKEMGEKYCQEFCHALTLDHEAVNSDSEQTFRKVTCFDKCSQSFARCHTTEKCMKNEWFNAEEIDDGVQDVEGKIKVDEVAAYNAGTCDPKIHYYKNCSLHSTDTDYWSVNFIDLLRLCNTRSKRIHYNNVFRNPSIKSKCNNLNFVGEDGKCLFTPTDASATETFKNCNSWDAPNCDKSTGYCSNTEETLNIEADYSMKTAWNNDADLEFCFPPKPHD